MTSIKNIFISIIYYYKLLIFLMFIINSVNSDFRFEGSIILYQQSILTKVYCWQYCTYSDSPFLYSSDESYNLTIDLTSLNFVLEFIVESSNNISGSIMGAKAIGSIFNDNNETCCDIKIVLALIFKNKNQTEEKFLISQDSFFYFELPENLTDKYLLKFQINNLNKYYCNSEKIFIKRNDSSNFNISDLIVNMNNNQKCSQETNITFYHVDEGFTMKSYETFPINTIFHDPNEYPEDDHNIIFTINKYGCFSLSYSISQENYQNIPSCNKTYIICYKSCDECYDCDGNTTNHKCLNCSGNHYKKIDDIYDNCYTEEERNLNFLNYYLNKESKMFEKCYFSCGKCRLLGNKYKHKCDKCLEGFYPTEGNEYPSNCYNEENKPFHYYFNATKKLYVKCYHTCLSCYGYGDEFNNNCEKCIKNHHFYMNETRNCIMEGKLPTNYYLDEETNSYKECYYTCKTCSKYKDENSQGCLTCNESLGYFLIVNDPGNCVTDAPQYFLSSFNSQDKIFEKCNINFCVECSPEEWYFVSNYTGQTFFCKNNGTYFNMQIYRQNEPLLNDTQSILNPIDIKKCENILRNKRFLRRKEEIIIVKKDYLNPINKEIINVEYYFYKIKQGIKNIFSMSTLLDISPCDGLDIFISIPRNLYNFYEGSYLYIIKTAYDKFNYDLLNNKDPFYNDYCTRFYINNSDLTINDRLSLFLPNKLCPDKCLYHSLKHRKINYFSDVNCNCNKLSNFYGNYSPIILDNDFYIKNNRTNIGIIKCYKSFLKSFYFKNFNLSVIIYILILIIYIFLLLYFCIIDNHKFRAKIYEILNNYKAILSKYEMNDSTLLNQKMDLYNKNKSKFYYTKLYSINEPIINLNEISYRVAKNEDNRKFISIFYSNLIDINFLLRIFLVKRQYDILSFSVCIFILQINIILILNSILCFDNIISHKYINGFFPTKKFFINIFILILINFVLCKFIYKYVFLIGKMINVLLEEYENKSFYFIKLRKLIITKYKKIMITFIIITIFILFGAYYNIIFNQIFANTQIIWIEQFITFVVINFMIDVIFSLIITIIRIISFRMQNSFLYNSSLIIKSLINKD